MDNEIITDSAVPGENSADNNLSALSPEEMRLNQLLEREASSKEANKSEREVNLNSKGDVLEEEKNVDAVDKTDVLSKIDFDNMSEEEIRDLAEKLGSRAVSRFAQLTAQKKQAEERFRDAEAALNRQQNNPFQPAVDVENNPYSKDLDIDSLKNSYKEVEGIIEWAEDVLFKSHDYSPDDVVVTVEGKEMKKTEVRAALLNAKKAKKHYLPAQYNKIQQQSQNEALRSQLNEKALSELQWLNDDSSDLKSKYNDMLSDPRLDDLTTKAPDIAAMLPYILGHAVNSIYGSQDKKPIVSTTPRIDPPSSPNSSASSSDKSESIISKSIKQLQSNFEQNGSMSDNDFIKFRTLKYQNK